MSKAESAGKWVWNVVPDVGGDPLKVTAGQMEVDSNGVHLCAGPGYCGGLIASFPLGTLVWREEAPVSSASPGVELVAGELAQFDQSPRVEIGAINITVTSREDVAPALNAALRAPWRIRPGLFWPF